MAITQTTTSAAITATQTTVPLAAVTNVTAPNFQTGAGITYLQIDQELMQVSGAPVGLVVPVVRGFNSTPAQAHTSGSLVSVGLPTDFPPSNETVVTQTAVFGTFAGFNWPAINLTGTADAIPATVPGIYEIKTGSADAMTIAVPLAAAEGNVIMIINDTLFAHTLTAPSAVLANGTALKTVATFPALRGSSLTLRASNGVWQVLSSGAVAGTVTFA